ncbi:MAG: LD-carboxypeptidase [Thermoanaerobaculia bacterium]
MPLVLPPAVRPGDRVGIAALSGAVDPLRLAAGVAELSRLGFEPVLASNLGSRSTLFAGGDVERVGAFHQLADDPTVRAIVFARGGHGVLRALPLLDWKRLAATPRAYVGYSDLTPFLLEIVRRLGWIAFHGPMVAVEFARGLSPAESASFLRCLEGDVAAELPLTRVLGEGSPSEPAGRLTGGCLSLLASVVGTPFAMADSADSAVTDGALLFLEEIHEPLYRIDRMLTQLDLSGSLTKVRAMVLGASMFPALDDEAAELVRERVHGVTVGFGLAAGHTTPNLTLPLGCPARIDIQRECLQIEPG